MAQPLQLAALLSFLGKGNTPMAQTQAPTLMALPVNNQPQADSLMSSAFGDIIGTQGEQQMGAFQPGESPQMMGASGMMQGANPQQAQQLEAIKQMGMSESPALQKQALSMLSQYDPSSELAPTTFMRNFGAFESSTPVRQKAMIDYKKSGAQNINIGGEGGMWSPEKVKAAGLQPGTVVTTDNRGNPKILKSEKYTQPQILSGGFASRMQTASDDIAEVMEKGFDPSGVIQNSDQFGMPGVLANYMRSPEGQQYRQAQLNWITANLRKESGAAIPEPETEREMVKYFPQPGDEPETIKQKSRARIDAEKSMQKSAGGAYSDLQAEKPARKTGGTIMTDANGNKAMVYSDGTFEEVK